MYNVHLTHSLLCFEFVEFTLIYYQKWLYTEKYLCQPWAISSANSYVESSFYIGIKARADN